MIIKTKFYWNINLKLIQLIQLLKISINTKELHLPFEVTSY